MRIDRAKGWAAAVFLALCLLLGGASGPGAGAAANGILQVLAVLLIVFALWTGDSRSDRTAATLVWIGGAYVAFVLASLVSLSPNWWTALPGREAIADGYTLLGSELPSVPLSLAPHKTIDSLLWMLPPSALYLLVVQLPRRERQNLSWAVIAIAVLSVVLGAAQLIGGPDSPLRFYAITNSGAPVGSFANANHFATLLLCALVLTGYLSARGISMAKSRAQARSAILAAGAIAIALLIGIASIGSLAGYFLALPASLAALLVYMRASKGRLTKGWLAALGALILVFVGAAVWGPINEQSITEKYSSDPSSRGVIAERTVHAIGEYFPIGTGLGAFSDTYRRFDNPDRTNREYVNHAHNDYLEFILELGLFGAILLIVFLVWLTEKTIRAWLSELEDAHLSRAASVIIALILFHSIVDYPLRTSAIGGVFAVACALLLPSARRRTDRKTHIPASTSEPRHLEAD